jgi:acyl-CoA synthetase (AMP-forming)/AMP-acid ligase II
VAVRYEEVAITYRELSERTRKLATVLTRDGLAAGDRVAVVMRNCPELLETLLAGLGGGFVPVPVNARLHPREITDIVTHAGCSAIFADAEQAVRLDREGRLPATSLRFCARPAHGWKSYRVAVDAEVPPAELAPVTPDQTAMLFYTSGTTGQPKGVQWTHRMLHLLVSGYLADVTPLVETDVVLHAAPLTHGSGTVALAALAQGAENLILQGDSFEPRRLLELVQTRRVSVIAFLAPTQIVKVLGAQEPRRWELGSLHTVLYGGGPMYLEHVREAMDMFGPVLVQIYGQGEAPMTITCLSRRDHARFHAAADPRLGSAGVARTGVEVQVVDAQDRPVPPGAEGEVVVRGDIVTPGYWDDPLATATVLRGGWLHTGDIGRLDEEGYLELLDRSTEMIVTGGNNVYPREVEEALLTHPSVAECAVFGVPDDYWGEAVHAVVRPVPGAKPPEDDLIEHAAASVARYKRPKRVELRAELPKNAYGKVLKRRLREPYWLGHQRRVGGGATKS